VTTDLPLLLVVGIAALLGGVVGSFLNVCILRWPADQSVVRPPSRCPRCGAGLRPWDNIPVISWLYPLIELATAAIWAGMVWQHGPSLEAARGAVFFTILLGIAMTDARTYLIPDEFSLGGLVIGLLFSVPDGLPGFGQAVLGAAVGFGVLWAVGTLGTWIFRKDAMGGGDIKMMAMVGAFLGWQGVLLTIFLGALLGTVIFVPISIVKRGKLVPFGIFLALGAAATWLAGPALIGWYRTSVLGL